MFMYYPGGKKSMLNEIVSCLPKEYNDYYEVFLGGGTLYFELARIYRERKKYYINEKDREVFNLYYYLQKCPEKIVNIIEYLKNNYSEELRDCIIKKYEENIYLNNPIDHAASSLFLRQTGFGGILARKDGKLVTRYSLPEYIDGVNGRTGRFVSDRINMALISRAIDILSRNTKIYCENFDYFLNCGGADEIKKGDLVYLDPPYYNVDTCKLYSENFDDENRYLHDKVIEMCKEIDKRGAYFLYSNDAEDYIIYKFKGYNIKKIVCNRGMINKENVDNLKKSEELLISNYELSLQQDLFNEANL